jgi:hypothetical protein
MTLAGTCPATAEPGRRARGMYNPKGDTMSESKDNEKDLTEDLESTEEEAEEVKGGHRDHWK